MQGDPGALLVTLINLNPHIDKYSYALHNKVWVGDITYPFPIVKDGAVEVWEWISNFTPHFMIDVVT